MFDQTLDQLRDWWAVHGANAVLIACAVAVVLALVAAVVVYKRGRGLAALSAASYVSVLTLSAQGTWHLLYSVVRVPWPIAVITCAIFEFALIREAAHAQRRYRATTVRVRAEGGPIAHGCPRCRTEQAHGVGRCEACGLNRPAKGWPLLAGWTGTHGVAVWVIAVIAGAIVAASGQSPAEVLLRLALPLITAATWWADLVAEGRGRSYDGGRFRFTPRRIAIKCRLLMPDDEDVETENARDLARRMTKLARKVHHSTDPAGRVTRWRVSRLERMALGADDDLLARVQRQVTLADLAEELTHPQRTAAPVSPATAPAGEQDQEEPAEASRPEPVAPHASEPAAQRVVPQPEPTLPANGGHTGQSSAGSLPGRMPAVESAHLSAAGQVSPGSLPGHMPTDGQMAAGSPGGQSARPIPGHRAAQPPHDGGQTHSPRAAADDDTVLTEHGEALLAELRAKGKLSRYRVQQVTGLGSRPAGRIAERVQEMAERDAAVPAAELRAVR